MLVLSRAAFSVVATTGGVQVAADHAGAGRITRLTVNALRLVGRYSGGPAGRGLRIAASTRAGQDLSSQPRCCQIVPCTFPALEPRSSLCCHQICSHNMRTTSMCALAMRCIYR
eukprot:365081-Chlamydomonas_euryale.AAC.10